MPSCPASLFEHSAHDVTALLAEWHRLAAEVGMVTTELLQLESWTVAALHTPRAALGETSTYLSTGIHGDEAGSAWGLLSWAKAHTDLLRSGAFVICPCLNPVGLARNTRADHRGLDINRRFHLLDDPLIAAWQAWVRPFRLGLCLCLHEDYDALGCYVYELSSAADAPLCDDVMNQVATVIPRDPRPEIEGIAACHGIIQRRQIPEHIEGPEAIVLYQLGCSTALTFETPSEQALDLRVRAQQTFIEAALELILPHCA